MADHFSSKRKSNEPGGGKKKQGKTPPAGKPPVFPIDLGGGGLIHETPPDRQPPQNLPDIDLGSAGMHLRKKKVIPDRDDGGVS